MTAYKVKVDYFGGRWVKDHPHPVVEVLAGNAKEAAESACGMALRTKGRAAQYCAQVWPLGGVRHAHQIAPFYSA
jgi:hypothetical protein